jgi:hypothetical protein
VRIEFDPSKDKTNQRKHGVSLALAEELDWDAALVWVHSGQEETAMSIAQLLRERGNLVAIDSGPTSAQWHGKRSSALQFARGTRLPIVEFSARR